MQRIISTVEKIINPDAPKVVAVNNATTRILDDLRGDLNSNPKIPATTDEIAARYIMNVGANAAYYALGCNCDATNNYHGILQPNQQLNCSDGGYSVDMFCAAGTTVAVTILRRKDLTRVPSFATI